MCTALAIDAARRLLSELTVFDFPTRDDYERPDYESRIDPDDDCLPVRDEVLERDSLAPVEILDCDVKTGLWLDPYNLTDLFTGATDVEIDHVVPLAHAHSVGGWQWDIETKEAFGSDLTLDATLAATGGSTNRQKGSSGPEDWLPIPQAQCTYVIDWIAIKHRWDLGVRPAELTRLNVVLDSCEATGQGITLPNLWPPPRATITIATTPEPEPVDPPTPAPDQGLNLVYCDTGDEEVLLRNDSDTIADLTGWSLDDEETEAHLYEFPDGFSLAPGEAVLIVSGPDATPGPGRLVFGTRYVWNNAAGDTAKLIHPTLGVVEELRCRS